MLDRESSQRLALLRFPLIVGVVFIHAYETSVGFSNGTVGLVQKSFITDLVRNFISQEIARIAVPLFFLMSGYLFFAGFEWSAKGYFGKLRNRIKSLLVPFLFWNIVTLFFFWIAQSLPATQIYFTGKNQEHELIRSFDGFGYLNAIIGIGRRPISYQFWFIRDLMALNLLVPILFVLNKRVPLLFLPTLFAGWFLGLGIVHFPPLEGTLFFSLGCYLASREKSLFCLDKYGKPIVGTYAILVIASALIPDTIFYPFIHKTGIVFGVIAALYATKAAANSKAMSKVILSLGGASFFVFATHEPLLTIARKVLYKVLQPESSLLVLFLYFLIPVLIIGVTVLGYRILMNFFPKVTRIITGGR